MRYFGAFESCALFLYKLKAVLFFFTNWKLCSFSLQIESCALFLYKWKTSITQIVRYTPTHTHTHKETFFNDVKKREVTRLSGYTLWPFRSLKRRSLSNPFCLQVNAHYLSDWQSHDLIWLSLCARNYLNCDVIFELILFKVATYKTCKTIKR